MISKLKLIEEKFRPISNFGTRRIRTMEEKGARDAAYANAVFQLSNSGKDWADGHYAQDGDYRGKPRYLKLDGSGGFYKHNGKPVEILYLAGWNQWNSRNNSPGWHGRVSGYWLLKKGNLDFGSTGQTLHDFTTGPHSVRDVSR